MLKPRPQPRRCRLRDRTGQRHERQGASRRRPLFFVQNVGARNGLPSERVRHFPPGIDSYISGPMTNEAASSTAGGVSIRIECLLFGRYAELLQVRTLPLQLPEKATACDVVARLRAECPNGKWLPLEPLVAVNRKHVKLDTALADGDEVALLPPLAGG